VRILFLHEVNYLEKPIFEMHEFPEHLAASGHEIGFAHFPEGYSRSQVKALGWKSIIRGRVLGDAKLTLYTPQNCSGSFLGRLWTAGTFRATFARILQDFRPDVVVSYSVPTSGWQAIMASRSAKTPLVFRALDVSSRIRKTLLRPLIILAERFVYRRANHVSANNPALADYAVSMGAHSKNVSVEKPPVDFEHFANASIWRDSHRAKLGIPRDAKVVVYMGSFFYFSGLSSVIEDFSSNSLPDQYLVLIGGGEQDQLLRSLVETMKLGDRVIFTGFVGFEELPKYLGIADVAINPMVQVEVANLALPNKVLQYIACGLPVVSFELPGLSASLEGYPFLTTAHSESGIWNAVEEVLNSNEFSPELARQAAGVLAQSFSISATVLKFERMVREIGTAPRG
jgi:glycosyltransferase involved in cell wall biosynthesis